jgi:DNA modification methylase
MVRAMRVERIGKATLYLWDCLEILPTLPKVDAVITDPPYGVLGEEWDDMDERELTRLSMRWLSLVSSLECPLITFFGERHRDNFVSLLKMLYPQVRQLIWNKAGGQAAADRFFYAYESIYLCYEGEEYEVAESARPKNLTVASHITAARVSAGLSKGAVDMIVRGKKTGLCYRWEEACCLPTDEQVQLLKAHLPLTDAFDVVIDKARAERDEVLQVARKNTAASAKDHAAKSSDVLTFSPPTNKSHPCEKPVQVLVRLVEALPDARIILDPFMGSGTTGVACALQRREFIGVEKDESYFSIACDRIANAQRQGSLLDAYEHTDRLYKQLELE